MSIEKALAELTEAVRENNELLSGLTAKAKAETSGKKAPAKGEDEGDDEEKPKRTRTTKPKIPTAKDLSTATTKFLEIEDEDEYNSSKAIIKKIIDKFDAAKMSEIEEGDRAEAMDLLNIAISGKDPFKKTRSRDDDDMA